MSADEERAVDELAEGLMQLIQEVMVLRQDILVIKAALDLEYDRVNDTEH